MFKSKLVSGSNAWAWTTKRKNAIDLFRLYVVCLIKVSDKRLEQFMEWQVKPVGRLSQLSGEAFKSGQKIISYLYKDDGGDLQRYDVLTAETDNFSVPGQILGWWTQVVRDMQNEANARRRAIETTEDLFLSLYEEGAVKTDESEVLKYLLAIVLERKRILRPIGKLSGGEPQLYRHSKSGEEYTVAQVDLTASNVLKIQDQLQAVI